MLSSNHACCGRRRLAALIVGVALTIATAQAQVEQVRVNGVPLAVLHRSLRGEPAQVAAELQRRWRAGGDSAWSYRGSLGSRVVLARQRGPLHESWLIAARAGGGGSDVIVSVLDVRRPRRPATRLPLIPPPQARLLTVVEPQIVHGPRSIEFLLLSNQALPAARSAWALSLQRAGWRSTDPTTAGCSVGHRGGEQLLLCLEPRGRGATVVLQWRRT